MAIFLYCSFGLLEVVMVEGMVRVWSMRYGAIASRWLVKVWCDRARGGNDGRS